jgi:UTP--glucose-1-phosphate uridylyltransferase
MPKEMLTVVDRPLIQHVVDEAREAGIEHFIFVTGRNKGVIEDHFDYQFELDADARSAARARSNRAAKPTSRAGRDELHPPAEAARPGPRGLVRARDRRRRAVRGAAAGRAGEGEARCLAQMIDAYESLGAGGEHHRGRREVPMETISSYGVVGIGKQHGKSFEITAMVEKPKREGAPSNLSITGRYLLQPEIFRILQNQQSGAGGEIQLTDAMIRLAEQQPFHGVKFEGKSYDCGSKLGFLTANVAYALDRPDIAAAFKAELKKLIGG